ncbi:PREDICTED: uncharacterized protein LOC103320250 [Prunus mume]|uniref:Uncharacterized protein LOC103320250 n=1 Tax=Prunus mume TaxID=102107 RepID=A0ABM0N665_PRUMU|nr:PREDICTED: uncharacterized protein LOC103320250 [Prunus mume]
MAMKKNVISLKALVDKGSNTIIFVESDNDFIDVLLSFLTIPMGTIVRRARKHSVPLEIGCMSNLYASVANIDVRHFQTEACKEMLLCPHNGAESHCKNLKLKIDNDEPTRYFLCDSWQCTFENKSISHYKGVLCQCGRCMNLKCPLSVSSSAEQGGGIFVKESARFIITDDLHVMSPLSMASNPVFTKLGAMNENSTTEQRNLNIGAPEVLNLLLRSLVSKKPLSETILKHVPNPNLSLLNLDQLILRRIESLLLGDTMNKEEEEENIVVKLTVSVSKNIVCYAEAGEDFVNLLFSFLTVPLGFIVKHMRDASFKGCIDQLHKSVKDLDEQHLKSNYHREILLSPKIYPGFCYENRHLGIEDGPVASYYYAYWLHGGLQDILATDKTLIPSNAVTLPLKLKHDKSTQGYLKASTAFMVTDKLIIRPASPFFGFSIINELKVPFTDIKEETVEVGKKEALRLLVATFLSNSALTDVFIRQLNQEKSMKRACLSIQL